jgi:hypothetical protein
MPSRHLDAIIQQRESAADLMVVFSDVVSYSRRRTLNQRAVIDEFTALLNSALDAQAAKYIDYMQRNDLNLRADTIRVPTGDGAAVAFSFDGLHHLAKGFSDLRLLAEWPEWTDASAPQRRILCLEEVSGGACSS